MESRCRSGKYARSEILHTNVGKNLIVNSEFNLKTFNTYHVEYNGIYVAFWLQVVRAISEPLDHEPKTWFCKTASARTTNNWTGSTISIRPAGIYKVQNCTFKVPTMKDHYILLINSGEELHWLEFNYCERSNFSKLRRTHIIVGARSVEVRLRKKKF